jgi:type IV secretion system protein VirB6
MMDFVVRGMKLVFIFCVATTPAYSSYVTDPLFNGLPNIVARAISGSDVTTLSGSFDQFFSYGAALYEKISESAGLDVTARIISAVVFVASLAATGVAFAIMEVARVALALVIAMGPIFVACALFDAPRRYFFGWLSQAVNFIVLFALIVTVFALGLDMMKAVWPNIDSQPNLKVAGMLFSAVCVVAIVIFICLPRFASGIAGGANSGAGEFVNALAFAAGRMSKTSGSQGSPSANGGRSAGGSIKPTGARA